MSGCTQTIKTDSDCLFFNFLDNCTETRIYPPLALYENEHFVYIRGRDAVQISIAKNEFEVELDGSTYKDQSEFLPVMLLQMKCVNESLTGGGGGVTGNVVVVGQTAGLSQEATQLLVKSGIDALNEKQRVKGTVPQPTYFSNFFSPNFSTIPVTFPLVLNQFLVYGAGNNELQTFPNTTVNDMGQLVGLFNSVMTLVVLSEKSSNEFWVEDGVITINDMRNTNGGIVMYSSTDFYLYNAISFPLGTKMIPEPPSSAMDYTNILLEDVKLNQEAQTSILGSLNGAFNAGNKSPYFRMVDSVNAMYDGSIIQANQITYFTGGLATIKTFPLTGFIGAQGLISVVNANFTEIQMSLRDTEPDNIYGSIYLEEVSLPIIQSSTTYIRVENTSGGPVYEWRGNDWRKDVKDPSSNIDELLNQDLTVDGEEVYFTQELTNPSNIVYPRFKKLSCVCQGVISVTSDGKTTVYPQTVSGSQILGCTFGNGNKLNARAVQFSGTGKVLVKITK